MGCLKPYYKQALAAFLWMCLLPQIGFDVLHGMVHTSRQHQQEKFCHDDVIGSAADEESYCALDQIEETNSDYVISFLQTAPDVQTCRFAVADTSLPIHSGNLLLSSRAPPHRS